MFESSYDLFYENVLCELGDVKLVEEIIREFYLRTIKSWEIVIMKKIEAISSG